MSIFYPAGTSIEVEPIKADSSVIQDDAPKFVEAARVVNIIGTYPSPMMVLPEVGDIVFFRPHGFFELPAVQGKKRYVVKFNNEIILGVLKNVAEKSV